MNINKKIELILWIRRATVVLTFILWAFVLYRIFQSGGGFDGQAPKCIISTMLIFGVLTAAHKGLELWEKTLKNDQK